MVHPRVPLWATRAAGRRLQPSWAHSALWCRAARAQAPGWLCRAPATGPLSGEAAPAFWDWPPFLAPGRRVDKGSLGLGLKPGWGRWADLVWIPLCSGWERLVTASLGLGFLICELGPCTSTPWAVVVVVGGL